MRIRVAVPDEHVTPEVVEPVLEAVTRLNEHMLASGQTPTSHELVGQGAIWRPENMGDEHFDHGGTIASRGWGDCDDWAPLHAATLRATGEDPGARVVMKASGPSTFHAMVERSNGQVETGDQDISVRAGMKSHNISGAEDPNVWLCDPHDGRLYQGSLMPSVGPISLHCGPGVAVRGCAPIRGCPPVFEGRVDLPIVGSPLVRVRSFLRHRPGRHRRVVGSILPYAISVTNFSPSKYHALHGALCGAMIVGESSGMTADIDRYKLLALQHAMAGASPGQVHEMLVQTMHQDLYNAAQASGQHPEAHSKALLQQTNIVGPAIIGGFFSDLGHIASSVVSDVSKVAKAVAKTAGPWVGDVLHGVEAAVSVVPGLGTAVSDVVAAAETAYETAAAIASGHPFDAAIHAAYNFATGTIPGAAALRPILDPVVNTLIGLTHTKEPIESTVLDGILAAVPDAPKIGPLSPRSVAASMAHLIVGHLGVKHTKGSPPPKSKPAARPPPPPHPNVVHAPLIVTPAKPAVKQVHVQAPAHVALPLRPGATPKPPGLAHAALHKVTRQHVDTVHTHV
jgi:hypothetical protein